MDEPVFMLTTSDNPWSPFTEFDEWYAFDESHGYHTSGYLGRIGASSPDLSPAQAQREVNNAIDEIVQFNLTGREDVDYIKVRKEDFEKT